MSTRMAVVALVGLMFFPDSSAGWIKRARAGRAEERETMDAAAGRDTVLQTYLDTLNLGRELYLTDEELLPAAARFLSGASDDSVKQAAVEAFRVQCFASNNIESARNEKRAVEMKISRPAYIVIDPPYYKILAGDFEKRQDAEKLLAELRKLGYRDAWIVRGKLRDE